MRDLGAERLALAKRIAKHSAPAQVKVSPDAARLQLVRLSLQKLLNAETELPLTAADKRMLRKMGVAR